MKPGEQDSYGNTPLESLPGVGPARAKRLAKLGLKTLGDLVFHLPRSHEDRRFKAPSLWGLQGTPVAVAGVLKSFEVSSAGKDLLIGRAALDVGRTLIEALWFRRRSFRFDPFTSLKKVFVAGTSVAVFGPWQRGIRGPEIRVEDHEAPWTGAPSFHMDRWTPVYDLTEGVDSRWLRGLIGRALAQCPPMPEVLPEGLRAEEDLMLLASAYNEYHFPSTLDSSKRARARLAFDEFFFLELALARVRQNRCTGPSSPLLKPTRHLLSPFRETLAYQFTGAQKRVINEIFRDMEGPQPMNRLLMGDVGSGKTVVAVSALLLAVENGYQAVLMAPTEILAEQHAQGLALLIKGLPVRVALLTGGRSAKVKKSDGDACSSGDIQIAVGTHALLQESIEFKNLGLAVIDEQHRFGVLQRATLVAKGVSPHTLLMTATPIPRTLALTLYGDLSVSVLDESPPGRRPIVTRQATEAEILSALKRAAAEGRQGFVVYPLVEESEKMDLRAVKEGQQRLQNALPGLTVGLLHGRMKSAEKDAVMKDFSKNKIQILAATPVIEVGIDVPNATVMAVMNAERFGLAQLHQLRGRVGRGPHPSACYLVSDGPALGGERLRLLCETSSGFVLAENDLRLRGPGEFLGSAQHGLPHFRAGNLATDAEIITKARHRAFRLLEKDPHLAHPDHQSLAHRLHQQFAHRLSLAVG